MNRATIVRIFCIASSITLASPIACMIKDEKTDLEEKILYFLNHFHRSPFPIFQLEKFLNEKKIEPGLIFEKDDFLNSEKRVKEIYSVISAMEKYKKCLLSINENEQNATKKLQETENFPKQLTTDKLEHRPFRALVLEMSLIRREPSYNRKIEALTNSFYWFKNAIKICSSLNNKKKTETLKKNVLNEYTLVKHFKNDWEKMWWEKEDKNRNITKWMDSILKIGREALSKTKES